MSIQYTRAVLKIYFFGRQQLFDGCQHQLSDGKPSQPSPFWTSWARLVFHTRDFVREKKQQKSKQETNSCNHIQMSELINVLRHFFVFFFLYFFLSWPIFFAWVICQFLCRIRCRLKVSSFFLSKLRPSPPPLVFHQADQICQNCQIWAQLPTFLTCPIHKKILQTSSSFEFDRQPDMP